MALSEAMPDTIQSPYNISQIDIEKLRDIELTKSALQSHFHDMNYRGVLTQSMSILNRMLEMLERYFVVQRSDGTMDRSMIENQKNQGFNFYQLKNAMQFAQDKYEVERCLELAFTNYELLFKPIYSIPTIRKNWRKKLVARLFSLAIPPNGLDGFFDKIVADYKATGCRDTPFNFLCYCEYRMPDFDLDQHHLRVGVKRSSKSTEVLQEKRRQVAFANHYKSLGLADKWLVDHKFAEKNIVYSRKQDLNAMLSTMKNDTVIADDAVLVADRRQGMFSSNVVLTQTINVAASNNNTLYSLIQNINLLEQRFVDTAATMMIMLTRGEGMLLSAGNNYGMIKQFIGVDIFDKKPWLLSDYERAKYNIRKLPSYIHTFHWKQLGDNKQYQFTGKSGNIFYDEYLANKQKWRQDTEEETAKVF